MNRFSALAIAVVAASASLVSTASIAQVSTVTAPAAQAQPAGKTRAEVVAEMEAARLRGELQAGHPWGIDVPPVQTAGQKVQLARARAASQAQQ
ncbi:DUF4148 domain-containing protein [Xylophilus sp. GOD-11R]|uniref:DUF4148 domain-containing protein n=1 Tax=Xylophilus sp. GOD-11R TaxID=3089814 RepID=UPI00298CF584|nr:DUF4148 domain-containing protein [Xylophilus sp. GOD-11R]WPB57401.1 hypothetical protein R9X41_01740 [Xylophilus sp. GOD-11R]